MSKFSLALLPALLFVASALPAGAAQAAMVENLDAETVRVIVSEDGVRREVELTTGATQTLCENGCFMTLPNGDMLPLSGPERVLIKDGAGRIER